MSAAFTPGPWRLSPHSYGYDLVAQGSAPDGYGGWLIELHSGERENDDDDFRELFEANAHLIAAAPELYEALEKCRDKFAEYAELHRRKIGTTLAATPKKMDAVLEKVERNRDMADLCIAALAKALGQ